MPAPAFDPVRRAALAAALAVLPPLHGCASPGRRAQLAPDDEVLALRAAGAGLYGLAAGQLALAQSQDPPVRAFGQMLVGHHEAANATLLGLLQARGVSPPRTLPAYLELRLARLQPAGGTDFDRQFTRVAGLEDQQRQLALHAQAALAVQDDALRNWFAGQLPALRSQLAVARSLAASLGA